MQKVDKGLAWLVASSIPPSAQFKRQGPGARLFRPFPGLLALLYVRVSTTIAWWRGLRASTVDLKSNLLLREARRPRRLAPVRMGTLYGYNRLLGFFLSILVMSLINQDQVGRLLVYLPSVVGAYVSNYNA